MKNCLSAHWVSLLALSSCFLFACSEDKTGQVPKAETKAGAEISMATAASTGGESAEAGKTEVLTQTPESDNQSEDKSDAAGILSAYKTKQVAANTYVIHGPTQTPNQSNAGFMNNPGFVVTDKSVVVIDPGSTVAIGRELVSRIKQVSDKPITHVFVSHIHGDHWLANQGIKEAFPQALFYAHPAMIEKAKSGDGEQWVNLMNNLTENQAVGTVPLIPENALEHLQDVKVDNITIRAHIGQKKAHTVTDVMYEVIEDKLLFAGDNITYKRIARMDDGSFIGNISAADYGLDLPVEVVVPGHGPTGSKEVIKSYRNYLSTVYESSKTMAEEGMEPYEMKPSIMARLGNYHSWPGIEDQLGKHISLSVLEAEGEDF